jgi:phosphopantothenoylcysteine synthetase/decarboxylase
MSKRAIVTAGSAVTMLDDVRSVYLSATDVGSGSGMPKAWHHEMQNIFRGALGVMIAKELVRKGIETTLIVRKDSLAEIPAMDGLRIESFKTFEQLEEQLNRAIAGRGVDIFFMSAAPPDYAPTKLEGKMRSQEEEITITYRRTPKLIDRLRPALGEKAFIVGFKLLVDVPAEELRAVATKQIRRADTDMCVGNDLARIDPQAKTHPMELVFSDGSTKALDGLKDRVSIALVKEVLARSSIKAEGGN